VWVRKGRESIFVLSFLVIRVPVFGSLGVGGEAPVVLECERVGAGV
jgi:hypothetical protein